jgi:hypothetical protein
LLQTFSQAGNARLVIPSLIGANIVVNASFKISAEGSSLRDFLTRKVVGNVAGLITVLTLT